MTSVVSVPRSYKALSYTQTADEAKMCTDRYIAFRTDPFNYVGPAPCSIANAGGNVVSAIKRCRFVMSSLANGNPTYVLVNTMLGAAEDIPAVQYPQAGNTFGGFTTNPASPGNFINNAYLTGGMFTATDLQTDGDEDTPLTVTPRCNGLAIRVRPVGPMTTVSGVACGWTSRSQKPNLNSENMILTRSSFNDFFADFSNAAYTFDATGTAVVHNWIPPSLADQDFDSGSWWNNSVGTTLQYRGVNTMVFIQGASPNQTYLVEIVAYYDYLTMQKGIGMSRSTPALPQIAGKVDQLARTEPTFVERVGAGLRHVTSAAANAVGSSIPSIMRYLPSVLPAVGNVALSMFGLPPVIPRLPAIKNGKKGKRTPPRNVGRVTIEEID